MKKQIIGVVVSGSILASVAMAAKITPPSDGGGSSAAETKLQQYYNFINAKDFSSIGNVSTDKSSNVATKYAGIDQQVQPLFINSSATNVYDVYESVNNTAGVPAVSYKTKKKLENDKLRTTTNTKLYANKQSGKLGYYTDGSILLKKTEVINYTDMDIDLPESMFAVNINIKGTSFKRYEPIWKYTFTFNSAKSTPETRTNPTSGRWEVSYYLLPNLAKYSTVEEAGRHINAQLSRGGYIILQTNQNGILIGKPVISRDPTLDKVNETIWKVVTPTLKIK